jgi:hypothetical protein
MNTAVRGSTTLHPAEAEAEPRHQPREWATAVSCTGRLQLGQNLSSGLNSLPQLLQNRSAMHPPEWLPSAHGTRPAVGVPPVLGAGFRERGL